MSPSDIELKVIIMEQCNVCMEEFNDLKTCGNSTKCNYKMCDKCLKKINKKLDKKCPQCRKVIDEEIDEETDEEIDEETEQEIDQETEQETNEEITESKCKNVLNECRVYVICGTCIVINVIVGAGIISIWNPSFFSVLSLSKCQNGCAALCLGSVTNGITYQCCYSADACWNDRYGVSLFDENNSICCCYKILKTYERSRDSQVAEEMERRFQL
jgi:hypothetical protein